MKKRILLAILRTPVYILMRIAEGTHTVCRWLWQMLEESRDLEAATVTDLQRQYGLSRYKAYELYRSIREKPIEIYANGAPLSESRPARPFGMKNIQNAL